MSYQVLARKWRPGDFTSVVGQTHVVRALQNALRLDRLHHAYLFVGTRGVGKTTLARIFAKCLNCESGVSAQPCGQCSVCMQINQGNFIDLIEIDAASRTGVDDMRDLLETVQYAPNAGRYKIYLIDEVHMLSISSFNALLKTLEEPPPHVKFFFATTDPQKLPVTILSRCLKFNLTRLTAEEIAAHLEKILHQEAVEFENAAVRQISFSAEGSVRDALSLLDQAIAYGNGALRCGEVEAMLGIVGYEHTVELLRCVMANDAAALFKKINDLYTLAIDFNIVLGDMAGLLNEIAIAQAVPQSEPATQFKAEDIAELANVMNAEEVQLFYQIVLHGRRDLPLLPEAKTAFEMTMMRMLRFRPVATNMSQTPPPQTGETKSASNRPKADVTETTQPVASAPKLTQMQDGAGAAPKQAVSSDDNAELTNATGAGESLDVYTSPEKWVELIDSLQIGKSTKQLCVNGILEVTSADDITIVLDEEVKGMKNDQREQDIKQAFAKFFGREIRINFKIADTGLQTPQQLQDREELHRRQQAQETIENDDLVKGLQNNFDANIVPRSVKISSR